MKHLFRRILGSNRLTLRIPPLAIFWLIIATSAALQLHLAWTDALAMDELAHIPAGYTYANALQYRLNPEHPPLVKYFSGATLALWTSSFPYTSPYWTLRTNEQWNLGRIFIYQLHGSDYRTLIFLARIFPIVLFLLLVASTYLIARRSTGPRWALLPAALVAFSPHFLAHGHFVTTDVGAAAFFMLALFSFGNYLKNPTSRSWWIAALVVGCAQLVKFSLLLLYPSLLLGMLWIWAARAKETHLRLFSRDSLNGLLCSYLLPFIKLVGVSVLLITLTYTLLTLHYPPSLQLRDAHLILDHFIVQSSVGGFIGKMAALGGIAIEHSTRIPFLRGLAEYGMGVLMVMQRASAGSTTYFLGAIGNGWWYYFPVIYLTKESLGALLFLCGGAAGIILWVRKSSSSWVLRAAQHPVELLIFIGTTLYWLVSLKSLLNIGIRHIFPVLPGMYILGLLGYVYLSHQKRYRHILLVGCAFVGVALIEMAMAYPHLLSFYNSAAGGTGGGHSIAVDSNYDWGIDAYQIRPALRAAGWNDDEKVALDFFGGHFIDATIIPHYVIWNSAQGDPAASGISWLVVSAHSLYTPYVDTSTPYAWLDKKNPSTRAGTSIFIYHR